MTFEEIQKEVMFRIRITAEKYIGEPITDLSLRNLSQQICDILIAYDKQLTRVEKENLKLSRYKYIYQDPSDMNKIQINEGYPPLYHSYFEIDTLHGTITKKRGKYE